MTRRKCHLLGFISQSAPALVSSASAPACAASITPRLTRRIIRCSSLSHCSAMRRRYARVCGVFAMHIRQGSGPASSREACSCSPSRCPRGPSSTKAASAAASSVGPCAAAACTWSTASCSSRAAVPGQQTALGVWGVGGRGRGVGALPHRVAPPSPGRAGRRARRPPAARPPRGRRARRAAATPRRCWRRRARPGRRAAPALP